jgi:DNA-binding Lrp family transcriptional regulator
MQNEPSQTEVRDDAIILEMKDVKGPFATAQELSERLGISRQRMNERLRNLRGRGILDRKQCGSGYGWWIREVPD